MERNPLVTSGQFIRVYAGDLEPGDETAWECTITEVIPTTGERVIITTSDGIVGTYKRSTTIIIKNK